MSSMMKKTLVAILKGSTFSGCKLDAADRAFLGRWVDHYADDPIWETIVSDARTQVLWPPNKLHSIVIFYALDSRRTAESVKSGNDLILLDRQRQRAELLALAGKADDLARYFRDIEKYSGIAMFYQRFLVLPVSREQEAVPRVEPAFQRVQQLQKLHKREAELLRQKAARAPKPTTFISRKSGKRHVIAFIHLMTGYMVEFCGKQHRHAVALLADIYFKDLVDDEYVRSALKPSTKKGRQIRAFSAKKR